MMTTLEIVQYYRNLLILQYKNKQNASGTIGLLASHAVLAQTSVQTMTFDAIPSSGSFNILIGLTSLPIQWDSTTSFIVGSVQSVAGYGAVTVVGSIANQLLTFTFTGIVNPPVPLLIVTDNTLDAEITVVDIDQVLLLAIQDAFNITGPNTAKGVQLDVVGTYMGVKRTYGTITLSDADFLSLIKIAIVQNNTESSMGIIEQNMDMFFPDQFIITDNLNMTMSYLFSQTIGSTDLFKVMVREGLLPHPMAVGTSVVLVPVLSDVFGFSTYDGLNTFVKPFNTYDVYNTTWKWISYSDAFS